MEHQLSSSFDHNRRTKVSYLINSLLIMQCSLLKGPVRVKWNVIGVFWCRCSWAISIGRDPTCNRSRGQKRALYELFNIRGHTTQSILPGFASENQCTRYPVLFPLVLGMLQCTVRHSVAWMTSTFFVFTNNFLFEIWHYPYRYICTQRNEESLFLEGVSTHSCAFRLSIATFKRFWKLINAKCVT